MDSGSNLNQSLLSQINEVPSDDPAFELGGKHQKTKTFRGDQGMVTTLIAKYNKSSRPVWAHISLSFDFLLLLTFLLTFLYISVSGIVGYATTLSSIDSSGYTGTFRAQPHIYVCYELTNQHKEKAQMSQQCFMNGTTSNTCPGLVGKATNFREVPINEATKYSYMRTLGENTTHADIECNLFESSFDDKSVIQTTGQGIEINVLQQTRFSPSGKSQLQQIVDNTIDSTYISNILLFVKSNRFQLVKKLLHPSETFIVVPPQGITDVEITNHVLVTSLEATGFWSVLVTPLKLTFMNIIRAFFEFDVTHLPVGPMGMSPVCDNSACAARSTIRIRIGTQTVNERRFLSGRNVFTIVYVVGGTLFVFTVVYKILLWISHQTFMRSCYNANKEYVESERRKQLAEDVVAATELC